MEFYSTVVASRYFHYDVKVSFTVYDFILKKYMDLVIFFFVYM